MRAPRVLMIIVLLVPMTGCGLFAGLAAAQLSDVEEIAIDAGGSCGLRTAHIDYQGASWRFDLPEDGSRDQPGWESDGVVVQVGGFEGEVWAVGPDGSRWRLVRVEEASLPYCLW